MKPHRLHAVRRFVTVLAAFFYFLASPVSGQQIRWSAPLEDDNQMKYLRIIGSDESDFFILRSNQPLSQNRKNNKYRKYRLACYSRNMALRWDKALVTPVAEGRILDVQMAGGRLLVSSMAQNGTQFRLFLQYVSADGIFEGQPVTVDEWNAQKMDEESRPELLLSANQTLFGVGYRLTDRNQSKHEFRTVVCDTTLAVLFRKEITVEAENKLFSPIDLALSDSGNIFLLGTMEMADKKGKGTGEGSFTLHAGWRRSDVIAFHTLQKEGLVLTDAALAADNRNNAVVVAGFYTKAQDGSAGVFYFRMSADSAGDAPQLAPFSEEFLKKFRGGKMNVNKDVANYFIERILLRRDGGAVISAESYSTYARQYYDYYSQMLISHTYYSYGNILTLSVHPDGSMHWSEVLNKDHNSTDDEGYLSSYCEVVYKAKMYYIYNKYIETKTSVMLTSVSSQGEQNTMVLFNEVDHIVAIPKAARQIEEDVLLLPALKENKLCIARISF